MFRRVPVLFLLVAVAACADRGLPTGAPAVPVSTASTPRQARERLAQRLALAMADPATRATIKRRLDASNAPEGKLQFQAFMHADQQALLASLARSGASTVADLLSDLDAAHGLELYLPVAAQRAAWQGDDHFLVATLTNDGEAPVAFDTRGTRMILDPKTPPDIPVLALVPQETDFTRGHPALMLACVDMCDDGGTSGGQAGAGASTTGTPVPGLYLIQSHFGDSYESWLKGDPEYEYHVYGIGDGTESVELACTGEHAGGGYGWDQNGPDWNGTALLISDDVVAAYQAKHPGAPIRIVAWEDDDEPCVDHADGPTVTQLIAQVDAAYKSITSGKTDPFFYRGIRAAPTIFTLLSFALDLIKTNDDFIGNGVETTVAGGLPQGANWALKTAGTVTTGWFTTARRP